MKRVLIITYYWPPSGGGGVMRWLKMSKYLPEFGWQPVIFTPENPDPSVYDESLAAEVHPSTEVIRLPIWEPYDLYRKITGKAKSSRFKAGYISEASGGSWKERLSVFIRGNLLIPDPRVFWVRPAIKFLEKYLREHPVDLIVSTGPPHSMHLIALGLKKSVDVPWLADFRDPWTGIDFYHRLKLTSLADKIHHSMEKKVLKKADIVTVVSPGMKRELEAISEREVHVIYNGFDPSDFTQSMVTAPDIFMIAHFGALNSDRNPKALWKALGMLSRENILFKEALKIRMIGQTDENILAELQAEGLDKQVEILPHMGHQEGVTWLRRACLLLLPLNDAPNAKGILPGKMYEYMALERPILAIGPEGSDCQAILQETQAGFYHTFDDVEGIRQSVALVFEMMKRGEPVVKVENTEQFSRRNLAGKIIRLAE